jgi:hypothetical protein
VKCQCGYIVDPFAAYGQLYDETNDGGLMTARRMTREQLKTLGLYPRIKPLKEHIDSLNEAAAAESRAEKKNKKQQNEAKQNEEKKD